MTHDSRLILLTVLLTLLIPCAIIIGWAILAGKHTDDLAPRGFTGGMDWSITYLPRPLCPGDRVEWSGLHGRVLEFTPNGRLAEVRCDEDGSVRVLDAETLHRVSRRAA